jgi:hypothetical protein
MEDVELRNRLDSLDRKLDAVYVSTEKTRKYFLTTTILTLVAFALPLIGLVFAIPAFLSAYSSLGSLGL